MMALLLNANDSVSRSYSITKPSPLHPITPIGCGERTENLWDRDVPKYVYAKDYKRYNPDNAIALKAGTYTISSDSVCPVIQVFDANHRRLNIDDALAYASPTYYKIWDGEAIGPVSNTIRTVTITLLLDCILTFAVNGVVGSYIMLNLGSTALPYEPYGYKLPILSNSTVTNIYLGEVETTRRIKKLVLTGEENYDYQPQYSRYVFLVPSALAGGLRIMPCFCTHYQSIYNGESIDNIPNNTIYINSQVAGAQFCIKDEAITTLADFKSFLAAQYAAGTPVTIWYILAKSKTGIVNEPLMKIGDYTDTIDSTQANVQIPTSKGTNIIDYDGALKPSQMYIKYLGVKK